MTRQEKNEQFLLSSFLYGGNADYMARLKLREVLLPRLVRPEEGHRPPLPLQRHGMPWTQRPSTRGAYSQAHPPLRGP